MNRLSRAGMILLAAGIFILGAHPAAPAEAGDLPAATAETLKDGERMYREGILPSGEPMDAFVVDDIPVPGTAFTCVSCHLRGGLGSVEGGVYTPPTNAAKLYKPLYKSFKGVEVIAEPPLRPAYTEDSLAEVIGYGLDPEGRELNEVMPRYSLVDRDMKTLIAYLNTLSADFSPGVTPEAIRFAIVIGEDVDPADRDLMLKPMDDYFVIKNMQLNTDQMYSRAPKMEKIRPAAMKLGSKLFLLDRWLLKGAPETWRSQLSEYYRRQPVFALLGGMVSGEWKPIHDFCEANQLPCLFPLTDFPVISESDWYTMYLSKGYYQEGQSAALFLKNCADMPRDGAIVEISRDSREGRALSAGFRETWQGFGYRPPASLVIPAGQTLPAETLQQALAREKPAALVVWDGPGGVAMLDAVAAGGTGPRVVILSAGYLGEGIWTLPERHRDRVHLTYPYRLPGEKIRMMGKEVSLPEAPVITKKTQSLLAVLTMAMMRMEGNYYRDTFLDSIGMLMDMEVSLYVRLSFGPGQRYASKGCYIVQVGDGPKPTLIRKSDWVFH
jgi:hypothetical protein